MTSPGEGAPVDDNRRRGFEAATSPGVDGLRAGDATPVAPTRVGGSEATPSPARSRRRRRRRRRGPMETPEYADMMARLVRRYGVRVGEGDPVDLTRLREVQASFDEALRVAVRGLHEAGFAWSEIGAALGTTKQAAFMRFRDPAEPPGVSSPSKSA